MQASTTLVVCCALMSCAKLVGIHDYHTSDADLRGPGDGASDGGSNSVPDCSVGLSQGAVCPGSLAVGVDDTCVIAPGGLYCWGQDVLGAGSDINAPMQVTPNVPTQVASSSSLDGFGSTFGTTCYLLGSDLTCWGNSEVAQLLQVTKTSVGETTLSVAFQPIEALVVGGDHMVATGGGSGVCWGATSANQCNSGAVGTPECDGFNTYCEASGLLGLGLEIGSLTVAGAAHTCTSPDENDGITCWGDNTLGQLGTESSGGIGQVQLAGGSALDAATGLALGASHSCAIVGSGSTSETYCWGGNAEGQLGIASSTLAKVLTAAPVVAPVGVHFNAIAAGSNTTCAIDTANQVWCWGADTQGMAGQAPVGNVFSSFDAPTITMVTDAVAIGVGYAHACAILASGAIECWGDNTHGELGDGVANHMNPACEVDDCSWDPVEVMP